MNQNLIITILALVFSLFYFIGVLFLRDKFLSFRNFSLSLLTGLTIGVVLLPNFGQLEFLSCFSVLFKTGESSKIPYLVGVTSSFILAIVSILIKKKGGVFFKIYSLLLTASLMLFIFLCFQNPLETSKMILFFGVPILIFCLLEKFVFDYIIIVEASLMSALLITVALSTIGLVTSLIVLFLVFVVIFLFTLAFNIMKVAGERE